jgi:hypothetical protein
MIPNFAFTTFPAFRDESELHLPSGTDTPVRRRASRTRAAGTGADAGYPFGPEVALPFFVAFLRTGHVRPLGLRMARGRRP